MPLLITNLEINFLIFQTQNKPVNKIYDTAIINRRLFLSSYYFYISNKKNEGQGTKPS
jgi:hypothetical protein